MPDIVYGLAALACPLGMGAMMWFMGKGMRTREPRPDVRAGSAEDLREEHRRLGAQIERLESATGEHSRKLTEAGR
jgi:hypothetical protein